MNGPNVGPIAGASENTPRATLRSLAWNRSEITPPAFVKGAEPKDPARKRKANKAAIVWSAVAAAQKTTNAA